MDEPALIVGNPIITSPYTSDPAVLVHEGTAHLYTGHDEPPPGVEDYVMRDWLCFSSTDLLTWQPHGPLLDVARFAWARDGAKAGAVVERDGRFFWYVAVNHGSVDGGAIGVAVADSPTGPFSDAAGKAVVANDVPFDTDDDHTKRGAPRRRKPPALGMRRPAEVRRGRAHRPRAHDHRGPARNAAARLTRWSGARSPGDRRGRRCGAAGPTTGRRSRRSTTRMVGARSRRDVDRSLISRSEAAGCGASPRR